MQSHMECYLGVQDSIPNTSPTTMDAHRKAEPSASQARTILTVAIVCPAIAALTVILRLYTRHFIVKRPSIEDALAALALV